MSIVDDISFFRPISFPEGKHPQENLHWLGRCVESFFDLGQRGYVAHEAPTDEEIIPIDHNPQVLTKGQKALKVFTVALKIIAICTVVIPFIMLIGKLIYRSVNYFEIVPKPNIEGTQREIKHLISKFNEDGEDYKKLLEKTNDIKNADFSTEEGLLKATVLYQEISSAMGRVTDASSPHIKKMLKSSDNLFADLHLAKERLQELKDSFVVFFQEDANAQTVRKTLDNMQVEAQKEHEAWKTANENWIAKQDALLATVKGKTDLAIHKEIHQKLCNETKKIEIKGTPSIDSFVNARKVFNEMIPDFHTSPKTIELLAEIENDLKPTGIRNLINSCYMNAMLQVLSANPEFYQMINTPIEIPEYTHVNQKVAKTAPSKEIQGLDLFKTHTPPKKHKALAEELVSTIPYCDPVKEPKHEKINTANPYFQDIKPILRAKNLQNALRLFMLAHRSGNVKAIRIAAYGLREKLIDVGVIPPNQRIRQQDSTEFMTQVLDKLKYPLIDVVEIQQYINPEAMGYRNESHNPQSILNVPIKNIENNMISANLQGLIDEYFTTNTASGERSINNNPNAMHVWNETTRLRSLPDTINLSLTRFRVKDPAKGTVEKVGENIKLPSDNIVDFSDAFAEGVVPEGESTKYRIVSVIQHMGGTSGGHYTAKVYKNSHWYTCNDSTVTPTAESIGKDGYLFVLKRL